MTDEAMSPLRRRMIEDMTIRKRGSVNRHRPERRRAGRQRKPLIAALRPSILLT